MIIVHGNIPLKPDKRDEALELARVMSEADWIESNVEDLIYVNILWSDLDLEVKDHVVVPRHRRQVLEVIPDRQQKD